MELATKITLTTVTEKTGLLGRKIETQEALTLHYAKGTVTLPQRVLEATGDSWALFCRRMEAQANTHGIPYEV